MIATIAGPLLSGLLILGAPQARAETRQEPPPLAPDVQTELSTWLEKHGQPPDRYVAGLFAGHDVVFLGEMHRAKHDALLSSPSSSHSTKPGSARSPSSSCALKKQPLIDSLLARRPCRWGGGSSSLRTACPICPLNCSACFSMAPRLKSLLNIYVLLVKGI